jgi:hypothetical protein
MFITLVAVAGVLAAAVLGVEGWLRHSIRTAIERAMEGTGASVEIGRVGVSLPSQTVSVRDVRIRAHGNDTARRGATLVSLDVAVGRIVVRGAGYRQVGGRRVFRASRVVVEAPFAAVVTDVVNTPSTAGATDTLSQAENPQPASLPAGLEIGTVEVRGAEFEHTRWLADGQHTRMVVGGVDLAARSVTLDSPPGRITGDIDSLVWHLAGGAQVLRVDTIALDTEARSVTAKSLTLEPQFEKDVFAEKSAGHKDWTALSLTGIECRGVNFARLAAEKTLAIDSVSLAGVDLASYKNRKIHQPSTTKPMLYEAVHRLPVPTDIAALSFEQLGVRYEELSENGSAPGVITLSGGRGRAAHITNIAEGNPRFMTLDLTAEFMDSPRIEARFLFPVDAADDHWELTGTMDPTPMAAFNPVLEPLMNVRITEGEIQKTDFRIEGSRERSKAHLAMAYRGLRVAFVDPEDHARTRRLLTVIADDLLIRPDNPTRNAPLREADAAYTRDPERSMWNYIWHSFQPAILRSVGN